MMTTANNIHVLYLEDTALDGQKLFAPKKWTRRVQQYIKKIHNVNIKQIPSGEIVRTSLRYDEKKTKSDKIMSGAPDNQQSR